MSFLQAAERQVNPFDNNKTAKNVQGNRGKATDTGSHVFNFLSNVANPIVGTGQQIAKQVGQVAAIPYNDAKAITGGVTNNPVATHNAFNQATKGVQDVVSLAQAVPRGIVQLGESVPIPGIYHAQQQANDNPLSKAILGTTPIPSLQKTYADTQQQTGSKTQAAVSTALSGLTDVAGVTGLVKGGLKAGENTRPLNEVGSIGKDVNPNTDIHIPVGDTGNYLRVSNDEMNKLTKATTPQDVKKIIGDFLPNDVVNRVAPSLASTKDPHIISNLLSKELTPTAPSIIPPPSVEAGHQAFSNLASHSPTYAEFEKKFATLPEHPDFKAAAEHAAQHGLTLEDYYNSLKQKSFLKTAQNADIVSPEAKQKVSELPQTYEQKANSGLVSNAKDIVAQDRQGTREDLLTKEHFTDQDVANAGELVRLAQKEQNAATKAGDTATANAKAEEAARIVETADTKLRASGRTVQAASLWSKLSPEGVLKVATRQVAKAREAHPNADQEQLVAKDLQNKVEGIKGIEKSDVSKTVQGIIKDVQNQEKAAKPEKSVGEQVAKRIESTVTPKVKAKADTLVNELTKKIKQEQLSPTTGVKKSPLSVLQEVFGRDPEARAAYPEAQRILQDKFANNPKALATLEKFFGSKLDIPAAGSTVNSAIKDQLIKSGEKIPAIIHKSWEAQKQSVGDIAKELTKEGFQPTAAKSLADEVVKRLNQQLGDAKSSILDRLAKEAPRAAQPSYLEKIQKLSNLGALDSTDYAHLARAKLKLPNLTTEQSKSISELAQKMQNVPDGAEKSALIRQIQEHVTKATPTTKSEIFRQIFSLPRGILASEDLSGGGRQGAVLGSRWWKQFASAQKDSVKAGGSQKFYDNGLAEIANRPTAGLREKAGVDIAGINGIKEEAFTSQLAEKIPGIGRTIAASDRAYTYGLSKLRADVFDSIHDHYADTGKPMESWSDKELKSLGRYINTSSGRGDYGKFLEQHAVGLSQALFSAKLWKSRLDLLSPKYYYDLKGPARKYAFQSAASFASIAATIMGLAEAAGGTVNTDARSSDFLKIKFGNTRYDILGGLQQNLVLGWREATGEKKSSVSGNVTKLGSKYGAADRLSILADFFKNKENPVLSAGQKIIKGKDAVGQPVNPYTTIGNLFVPLGGQDVYQAAKDTGSLPKGILKAAPGFVGAGVNTYGTNSIAITPTQQKYVSSIKDKGQANAAKSFYQTLKTAPNRNDAEAAIKDAIKAKDMNKAIQLAKDYNKAYGQTVSGWSKQNAKYKNDQTLVKSYEKRLITDNSFNILVNNVKAGK